MWTPFARNDKGEEIALQIDGFEDGAADKGASAATGQSQAASTIDASAHAKLQADYEASQKRIRDLEASGKTAISDKIKADAKSFASEIVAGKKLMPVALDAVANLKAFAGLSAAGLPTEGIDLAASIDALVSGLVPHNLTDEAVSDAKAAAQGVIRLDHGANGDGEDPEIAARKANDRHFAKQGIAPVVG